MAREKASCLTISLADHTLWARGVKDTFLELMLPFSVLMWLLENLQSVMRVAVSSFSRTALPQPFGNWGEKSHNLGEMGRWGGEACDVPLGRGATRNITDGLPEADPDTAWYTEGNRGTEAGNLERPRKYVPQPRLPGPSDGQILPHS